MYGCSKACLILIPFRLPHISCFPLSLQCLSSDSDSCRDVGIGPLLQFPHPPRAGPVLLTFPFFPLVPSSHRVLCGSTYSFLLGRHACPLSAGVLHALLCLKVHSWCIRGEMYSMSTYSSAILFSSIIYYFISFSVIYIEHILSFNLKYNYLEPDIQLPTSVGS